MTTNLSKFQKTILAIFAAMAVVFAICTAVSRSHEGVLFRDELLKISQQDNVTAYSGKLYGTSVTITVRKENGSEYVSFDAPGQYHADCRVEHPEGTIKTEFGTEVPRIIISRNDEVLFSGGVESSPTATEYIRYFKEDGSWEPLIIRGYSTYYDPWHEFEFSMADIVEFTTEPETIVRGSWLTYFAILFGSIIAALGIIYRDEIFYLRHYRIVSDPEPTEYFYTASDIGSVIGVVTALVCYLIGVFTIV